MKVKVILLSGTLGLSGSTTWINNLSVGLSRLGIEHAHLVVGVPGLIASRSNMVLYTGRSRSDWYIKLLRWIQIHKLFKNFFSKVEARFFDKKCRELLAGVLCDRVLVIKDFNSYLPDFFLSDKFVIVDVLHNSVSSLKVKEYKGHLIAVSEVIRQKAIKLGYLVNKTIYNPIEIEELIKKSTDYKVACAAPYIVYVGSLYKEKGVFDLLEAYASSDSAEVLERKLVFIGTGKSFDSLRCQIVEKGLEERVIFTGFLENPYPWIAQADLLVLPSYSEAMPYAPIEASVLGTAYLVADFKTATEFFCPENIYPTNGSSQERVESLQRAMDKALLNQHYELLADLKVSLRPEVVAAKYFNLLG